MKTILIVEDEELNIDLLTQLLEDDYRLLVARDGAEGVALAQQYSPDLVLMDIALPGFDGYEATRRIRAVTRTLPIIGLSSYAMPGDAEKAMAAGCTDYLTKPVDEELLLQNADGHLVEKALSELPVRFREILVLRELEGLSYKEIADVMDVPMGTVMSTLSRARDRFRKGAGRLLQNEQMADAVHAGQVPV